MRREMSEKGWVLVGLGVLMLSCGADPEVRDAPPAGGEGAGAADGGAAGAAGDGSTAEGGASGGAASQGGADAGVDASDAGAEADASSDGSGADDAPDGGAEDGDAPACADDADCDDGLFCNGVEACANGTCTAGWPPSCDDGIPCTVDLCDDAAGACLALPDHGACDDGALCNGVEVCVPKTGCAAGPPPSCDDGVPCTLDSCDPAANACIHTPDHGACDDGLFCTGAETCDPGMGCVSSSPPSCADGVACTQDYCDGGTDACAHVPNDMACSDGKFCNGAEVCDPMTGCTAGAPIVCDDGLACTGDLCSDATSSCVFLPSDAACSDGAYCNGVEKCKVGVGCVAGAPIQCDDANPCTIDACDEAAKTCTYQPSDALCDDGLACNGAETCVAGYGNGCVKGSAMSCAPDKFACTVDACDEAIDACASTPDDTLCPAGQFCRPALGGCVSGQACSSHAECDDGDACNGVETCGPNGLCVPGAKVSCDDGVPCTLDSCSSPSGACLHLPDDALCDDGLLCNGKEWCDPAVGCTPGAAPSCDDGVACTGDHCDEATQGCKHVPEHAFCSDGKVCNGVELCDPVQGAPGSGCLPGPAYTCPDDGVACTVEVCDPASDLCKSIPDSKKCPCGQTCQAGQGCGNFCQVATCQGKVYACGDCLDNDGDCAVDSADSQCLGPCDHTEDSFYGGIPGQNNAPCKSDCYFDQDTGAGNDECYWSHRCDPLSVPPDYPPEGSQCSYDPGAKIPGSNLSCGAAYAAQAPQCLAYCGPLTPNGCDCFGCCELPAGSGETVWLGSTVNGAGSCNLSTLGDPSKCKPCTQVPACLNPCDPCEICVGKPILPDHCVVQECPGTAAPCGQPGQPPCAVDEYCVSGCCQPLPQ